ncbi:uncharacterized protein LOC123970382 [Micropterus dolomieu]|uniref:uncharacterized protein LOC123970382 n=1 Tax=Micropterus dolomieu TaxID=147949 RepID=UPI001E8E5E2F|nr:uncharacterized protein LOC123970382 [Micropterus dolomieu]
MWKRTCTSLRQRWSEKGGPRHNGMGFLAPFLTGEALQAFQDVEAEVDQDYDLLKEEIQSRHGLTKFSMAQRFHSWSSQMHELIRITKNWLEPENKSPAAIVETLVMDRYLRALPYEAKKTLSQQKLTSATALVEALEQYQAASEMLRSTRKETVAPARPKGPSAKASPAVSPLLRSYLRGTRRPTQPQGLPKSEAHQCFHCGEWGHISWQCEKSDEKMPTAESASSPHVHFAAFLGEGEDQWPTCPVIVNHWDVEVLLDSGSSHTLVQEAVLEEPPLGQNHSIPVVCVHGETREYPTAVVKLTTTKGAFAVEVGVVKTLPVPVLIGRDCLAFPMLWREAQRRRCRGPQRGVPKVGRKGEFWAKIDQPCSAKTVVAQGFAVDSSGLDLGQEGPEGCKPLTSLSGEDVDGPRTLQPLKGESSLLEGFSSDCP